ncbi:MAG: ATP-binding cassette domain-containing protein, partial [Thermoguttaceae bacterium]
KMIAIDQSPIGRTPRSNPATYIKLFDEIRMMFAELPEAKQHGFKPGRFSFNVDGGRCEACQGYGSTKLEMDFLADIWVTCPVCGGKRFNYETLQVKFKGHSIAEILEMDVQEAMELFENVPKVYQKLKTLHDVGLDYMKIGQSSPTLSGGEAQRVKLARELTKVSTGRTIYILDEPTTGLHFADIEQLLKVLHGFADAGNTVLVVEHNLDVIKTADWIIDLGPEGGNEGGQIVVCGTPRDVVKCKKSYTAAALKNVFTPAAKKKALESVSVPASTLKKAQKDIIQSETKTGACSCGHDCIHVEDASQHNLKHVSVEIPRNELTVCCGPSGSGKSSMAMDTVYAEGQRRYVESLSSYARQFVGQMQKPHVERIEGLSPAIAIEQKRASQSPRSTVGTITEIYDYLRILMARLGKPYCPDCQIPVGSQTTDEIISRVMKYPEGTRLMLLASREVAVGHRFETLWDELRRGGFVRVRIDGMIYTLDQVPDIDRRRKHDVEVVVDRVEIRRDKKVRARVAESVEQTLLLGGGTMIVLEVDDLKPETMWKSKTHSLHNVCDRCGRSFETLAPNNFSFNTALGWCPTCEGLGVQSGANPNLLLRDPKLTLAEGAISLWNTHKSALAMEMLKVFCTEMEVPMDVP